MLERLNTSSSLPFTYLGRDSIGVPGRQCIQDLLNVPFSLGSERFAWMCPLDWAPSTSGKFAGLDHQNAV